MVKQSVGWICQHMDVHPNVEYTGGERGWIGDNPFIFLDTAQVRSLGWTPQFAIKEAVERTVADLMSRADELGSQ
jgi:UDP-glucose 4-epimerase